MQPSDKGYLSAAEQLSVHFKLGRAREQRWVQAVEDVTIGVRHSEVLGLVGESGSGKSTLGRALLRLNTASSGKVWFNKQEITTRGVRDMRPMRRHMQMIFQDPHSSINPRMRIRDVLCEPLVVNRIGSREEREQRVREVLQQVQLPLDVLDRSAHQLSGGQKQRVAIARALITRPHFIVADEPVSALDVSVQAQILNLLSDLRQSLGLTILMISHDLSVVRYFSDRVAVMYLGRIMEIGTVEDVFDHPAHPYTRALIDSVPEPDLSMMKRAVPIYGEIPSPVDPPSGCVFRTRCPVATPECAVVRPELRTVTSGHEAACILLEDRLLEEMK